MSPSRGLMAVLQNLGRKTQGNAEYCLMPQLVNTFELLLCVRLLVERCPGAGYVGDRAASFRINAVSVGRSEVLWCCKGPGNGRDQKNKRTCTEVLA